MKTVDVPAAPLVQNGINRANAICALYVFIQDYNPNISGNIMSEVKRKLDYLDILNSVNMNPMSYIDLGEIRSVLRMLS